MITEKCDTLVTNRTRTYMWEAHRQYIMEEEEWKNRLLLKLKTEK